MAWCGECAGQEDSKGQGLLKMGGIEMDFESTKKKAESAKNAEADGHFGGDVAVTFKLPDGTQATHSFKMGHTVEYVKAVIHKEHGIPMAQQRLKFQDRDMIDPLSLVDIRGFEDGEKLVEVQKVNRAYRDLQAFLVKQIQLEYGKIKIG